MPTPELSDGNFSSFDEVEGGVKEFPFLNRQVKDSTTYIRRRIYEGERSAYTPAVATLADPDDDAALLLDESKPTSIGADLIRIERLFGLVPTPQVSREMKKFPRPTLNDLKVAGGLGGVWAVSFDELATSTLFFTQLDATIGAITLATTPVNAAAEAFGTLPGTNIDFTDSGNHSTSIPLNTSKSSMQTTLAGTLISLSNICVSGSADSVTISWTGTMKSVGTTSTGVTTSGGAGTNGSITFTAAKPAVTAAQTYSPNTPTNIRTVSSTGHGGAAGDWVVLWLADNIVALAQVFTAATDSFTVAADSGPLAVGSVVISKCQFAKNGLRLANGVKDCTIRTTENYYRAGVTTGITTLDDVPSVPTFADAIAWLGRIVATTHTSVTATAATDKLNKTAHGLSTGDTFFILDKGTGAAGLSTLTQYWAIKVDADNWKAATSAANALAGTAVDITTDSTGAKVLVPDPWPAISVGEFQSYYGPVVFKTTEAIQMADALEARDPSA